MNDVRGERTYDIGGPAVLFASDGLERHPLDGTVLVVAQTVVVGREEIARQRRVAQFHLQLIVHPAITTNHSSVNYVVNDSNHSSPAINDDFLFQLMVMIQFNSITFFLNFKIGLF